MKQLTRNESPSKLVNSLEKKKLYENLRDEKGKIRPRWNTMQKDGVKVVREALKLISNECCCFCGSKVQDSKMDVDHYLPSSKFPYLAYCWENLLPTCKQCNQTFKGDFYPRSLHELMIIESCMNGSITCHHVYDHETILEICENDRIIDPTIDKVENHLEFNPEFFLYDTKTQIGINTNEMFFNRDEVIRHLEGLSNIVKGLVKDGCSKERLQDIIFVYGQEFYYNSFFDYWIKEKEAGRLR